MLFERLCHVVRNAFGVSEKSVKYRNLKKRDLRLEALEDRQLLSINTFELADVQDAQNYLSFDGWDTEWHYQDGKPAIVGSEMTILQNAEGEVKIQLLAEKTGDGTFRWDISDRSGWSWADGSDVSANNLLQSVLTWKQGDEATPVRSFDIVCWDDVNNDGQLSLGEDSQTFTVNIQWANVSLCVNQPTDGSDAPAAVDYYGTTRCDLTNIANYQFDLGHSYYDIRGGSGLENAALPNFADYANRSWGYSALEGADAAAAQVLKYGYYAGEGVLQEETSTETTAYQTFTLTKISDLNNLLDFTKSTKENPGSYVLTTDSI